MPAARCRVFYRPVICFLPRLNAARWSLSGPVDRKLFSARSLNPPIARLGQVGRRLSEHHPVTAGTESAHAVGRSWRDVILTNAVVSPVVLVTLLLTLYHFYDILFFHTLVELYCLSLGALMFSVAWNTKSFTGNGFLLFMGSGYLIVGVLDGFHTFSMPEFPFFNVDGFDLTLRFWIYTRLFEAFVLILAPLFLRWRLVAAPVFFALAAVAVAIIVASLNNWGPTFADTQSLNAAKIQWEYVIMALFLLAAGVYLLQWQSLPEGTVVLLVTSLLLKTATEFCLTRYSVEQSPLIVIGHLFKFISYWLIYLAIVRTLLTRPFEMLSASASSYDALPFPAGVVDSQGMIASVNQTALKRQGATLDEIVHTHVHDRFHDCATERQDCVLCNAIATGVPLRNQPVWRAVEGDKPERHMLVSLSPIRLGDTFVGMVQSAVDVTAQKVAEEALRTSEHRYHELVENMPVAVAEADRDGRTIYVNRAFTQVTGLSLDEVRRHGLTPVLHEDDYDRVAQAWAQRDSNIYPTDTEFRIRKKGSNEVRWLIGRGATALRDDHGNRLGYIGTYIDVTELKTTRERLSIISHAVEQTPVSVVITDLDGRIEYVNLAFEQVTGYSIDEVRGQNPRVLNSGKNPPHLFTELWARLSAGEDYVCEMLNKKKNGELFWEKAHFSVVEDDDGQPYKYMAVKEDISVLKKQEEQLQFQANYDSLTDLPNRFLSLDRMGELIIDSMRTGEHFAVIFLDLDDFKKVNDSLGHDIGDKLLCETAERLRHCVRAGDTVGRLGGDEFVVLLRNHKNVLDTQGIAEKVLNALREQYAIDQHVLKLSASIGIAVYPDDGKTVATLLRNADTAMYKAKALGRDSYTFFAEEMNNEVQRQLEVEMQLQGALERGEFAVHYQPKYNLESGEVFGAEALVRWDLPERGLILPSDFIPIAEDSNLIIEIGEWVLDKVCEDFRLWQRSVSSPGRVSVNLSLKQLRQLNFVSRISAIMRGHEVSPTSLELEITETTLMENPERTIKILDQLYGLGLNLAIDDFGTGYSSLSALQQFPISTLKIDRSFVRNIVINPDDATLVDTIIQMGRNLNMEVVAEGVEDESQLIFLQKLGCTYAQGLLFGDPMSSDNYLELLLAQAEGTDTHRALFA